MLSPTQLLAVLLLTGLSASSDRAPSSSNSQPGVRSERAGFSFLAMGDSHFGERGSAVKNKLAVSALNAVSQSAWPEPGGDDSAIGRVRALLLLGDITHDGLPEQFAEFSSIYGLNGERVLQFPVMESFGNHDFTADRKGLRHGFGFPYPVMASIASRHDERDTRPTNTGSNAALYSWDWHGVHFVNLGLKAGYKPDLIEKKGHPHRWTEAYDATGFLDRELNQVGPSKPVVITMHYPLRAGDRISKAELQRFHQALVGHKAIALLHAHTHGTGYGRWCGLPVYDVGSPHHDRPQNRGHGLFSLFRIRNGQLEAFSVSWAPEDPKKLRLPANWHDKVLIDQVTLDTWPCGYSEGSE